MKLFKRENFLETHVGVELIKCIRKWDYAINEMDKAIPGGEVSRYYERCCYYCHSQFDVYQIVLDQVFGVEYFFVQTQEYFGVAAEDDRDWLIKIKRAECEPLKWELPEELLKTGIGAELEHCVRTWDHAIEEKQKATCSSADVLYEGLTSEYWEDIITYCQAQWEVYKMFLQHLTGKEYDFIRTHDFFGVATEDQQDWLIKIECEEREVPA